MSQYLILLWIALPLIFLPALVYNMMFNKHPLAKKIKVRFYYNSCFFLALCSFCTFIADQLLNIIGVYAVLSALEIPEGLFRLCLYPLVFTLLAVLVPGSQEDYIKFKSDKK